MSRTPEERLNEVERLRRKRWGEDYEKDSLLRSPNCPIRILKKHPDGTWTVVDEENWEGDRQD